MHITILTVALVSALTLSGCSSKNGAGSMAKMENGEPASTTSEVGVIEHNDADATFAQGMIPHHQQAMEMSRLMLDKPEIDVRIAALATRITAAQGPEIAMLTSWLTAWREPLEAASGKPLAADASMMGMNGMMTDEELLVLKSATGADAGKIFLTGMIEHHEGAVAMARTETYKGSNPDAIAMANDVISAQEAQIKEMKEMMATMPGT